ncbi:MAG: glycosyltransferase [Actinomycetota bacterium]
MKVSLVTTVKDAAADIGEFLTSVRAQTRPPEEIVIVDGGSSDGTLEALRAAPDVTLLDEPGAGISRGRNVGIRAATHDLIALSDGDCVLSPVWLQSLTKALEDGADAAMGFTRPIARGFFEACSAAIGLPEAEEVDPDRYMPSSRSIAFRRETLELVGGYPEWLPIGEDMWLNHRLRELALDLRFVPEAVAYWRMRGTLPGLWRQYSGYAWGDGYAGLYQERHAIRFGAYGALVAALAVRSRPALGAFGLAAAWYASRRIRRAMRLLPGPVERTATVAAVPALMALIDVAKMAGYVSGRLAGRRRA